MVTMQGLAKQAFKQLQTKKRPNGNSYVSFKTGSPDWMKDMSREAHGSMLPDDQRYRFIEMCLEAISIYDEIEDARNSLEADIYTSDLTAWLSSRNDRMSYLDTAIEEWGKGVTLSDDLQRGQLMEIYETFDYIVSYLTEMVEEAA